MVDALAIWWPTALAVVAAHALAVASPGPDFAVVVRQSSRAGRAAALWTAFGIGTGILVHVGYAVVGIGLLIAGTPWLMNAIALAGAAYLLWIGLQSLRAQPASHPAALGESADAPVRRLRWPSWRLGFVTNVLNPKATLFFLALFTSLMGPDAPLALQIGLGLWMAVATGAWFCLVGWLMTGVAARGWFARNGHWIDRAMGVILIALALRIAAEPLAAVLRVA